jgi:hypothetical protein
VRKGGMACLFVRDGFIFSYSISINHANTNLNIKPKRERQDAGHFAHNAVYGERPADRIAPPE